MRDFIPPQFKIAVFALAAFAFFLLGAVVRGWQLEAGYAAERLANEKILADLKAAISERDAQIQKQNAAIDLVRQQVETAELARKQAQRHADEMAELSRARIGKIETMQAKDCADLLLQYWELRK